MNPGSTTTQLDTLKFHNDNLGEMYPEMARFVTLDMVELNGKFTISGIEYILDCMMAAKKDSE